MQMSDSSPIPDLVEALRREIDGEVRVDLPTRLLYSTDASIYQIEPLGVVIPRTVDELSAVVKMAAGSRVPLLARGAGSSLAGQAIGEALIVDCSRYLDQHIEIHPEESSAVVEPGVILSELNKAAAVHGLQFGPDPASADRATMAGSIASNATGAHSIRYGMTADHLLSTEVVLSDGTQARFELQTVEEARRLVKTYGERQSGIELDLLRTVLKIREEKAEIIRDGWPKVWRRASGYNLNYLLPWSPSAPPEWPEEESYPPIGKDQINLASLIAGSEGTLAVIRRATVKLVPRVEHTVLAVIPFENLADACDSVPDLLAHRPSAIELLPRNLIHLARSIPAYARQLRFLDQLRMGGQDPAALLIVEFSGGRQNGLIDKAKALGDNVLIAESKAEQAQIWSVRKVGLGLLMSRPGEPKPIAIVEDLSVPVERLGEYVREMGRIFQDHGTQGDFYAHASAGCLHVRPFINLKTREGVKALRSIAEQAIELVVGMDGASTGEHGDGLARSEWIERVFGKEIVAAFSEIKRAADPHGILNPGKILDAPPIDANLRYGTEYTADEWPTRLNFSKESGISGAVELCNGAGVCRKRDGVMCPSFQATSDEMHSTRGRANLLRAMLSGKIPDKVQAEESVFEALDLCLACKGCKAECPSAVDMAKLKYEFLHRYYSQKGTGLHRRKTRDYLFAFIELFARLGYPLSGAINRLLMISWIKILGEYFIGISAKRTLPQLNQRPFHARLNVKTGDFLQEGQQPREQVLLLIDAFTEYFYPETGIAAVEALKRAECDVIVLPVIGAGRTEISKGFLPAARKQAAKVIQAIYKADPEGKLPVVGVEPSEIYSLKDEYPDLLGEDERVRSLTERVYTVEEFLIRPRPGEYGPRLLRIAIYPNKNFSNPQPKICLHGHCYQKAQPPAADGYASGVEATLEMLSAMGFEVQLIESGCCGMAGAFGYEQEHYDLSMQIGELKLFPAVRNVIAEGEGIIICAPGISCQSQILDGTGVKAIHPIRLIADQTGRRG